MAPSGLIGKPRRECGELAVAMDKGDKREKGWVRRRDETGREKPSSRQ